MFNNLITGVLNNYVGEYLENINAHQLSIALLQGEVELENVPLKKTALRKLDIPLQVKSGVIGKLTLSVPMTRMKSEPWILKMSDLLVVLSPSDENFNAKDFEADEQAKKEQLLTALETHHKSEISFNMGMPAKEEATQNQYWGASLVSAVTNNIQLIISNVHIRYEDDSTMPNKAPFNIGFRIEEISIQTTTSQWKVEFIQPAEGVNVFKKLNIKGFSLFWNCHHEVRNYTSSAVELKASLCTENSKENHFILHPFTMQALMEKNSSKLPLNTVPAIPRFKVALRPEKINIELSKKQFAQIRRLSREWARFDRARQHRKWRPSIAVKGNSKEWWKFAIGRVMDEVKRNRQRCSIKFLVTRTKELNLYCKAYKKRLEAFIDDQQNLKAIRTRRRSVIEPSHSTDVSFDDDAFLKQIELDSNYSYHELHIFRETVFRRLMREKEEERKACSEETEKSATYSMETPKAAIHKRLPSENNGNNKEPQGLYGWVSTWFGSNEVQEDKSAENQEPHGVYGWVSSWFAPNQPKVENSQNLQKIEKKIEAEIKDVLSESWDDSTVLRRDNLLAEIDLKLERIIIRFVDDNEKDKSSRVIAMDWRYVSSRVQLSPREHRTGFSLSVGDMSVQMLRIEPSVSNSEDGEIDEYQFTTHLLFAIGKAKPEEILGESHTGAISTGVEKELKDTWLKMNYCQKTARFNVLQELDANFCPLSVIYDDDATNVLTSFLDSDTAFIEKTSDVVNVDLDDLGSIGETHGSYNISIPYVLLELRSCHLFLATKELGLLSSRFACAQISNVNAKLLYGNTEKIPAIFKMDYIKRRKSECLLYMNLSIDDARVKTLYSKSHGNPLDDSQNVAHPIIRLILSSIQMEAIVGRNLTSSFHFNSDYYNPVAGGWEPFIEPWKIKHLNCIWKPNRLHLGLKPAPESSLDMNITPTFVHQLKSFFSNASNEVKILDEKIANELSRQRAAPVTVKYFNFNVELELAAGMGISLVNDDSEEIIYARLHGVHLHFCRVKKTYKVTGHVNVIQADNQLLTAEKWQALYGHSNAIKKGTDDETTTTGAQYSNFNPALKVEICYTPMERCDLFKLFRLKSSDMCILLDETLLWKLLQFWEQIGCGEENSTPSIHTAVANADKSNSLKLAETPSRRCYFDTLDLEFGNIALTVLTVAKYGLPKDLQLFKRKYSIKLVSFENAIISLPPFKKQHYDETVQFLVEALSKFYMIVLIRQTMNIVFTMDAFGNPLGLVKDMKDSLEGLVCKGDVAGFVGGLGYGVTNSFSKALSSMSRGVGSLTFDDQHEAKRKKAMTQHKPSTSKSGAAFSHLRNGFKGLGVGVFGGLKAIVGNTAKAAKKDGLIGLPKGIATGVVDTVTKPAQGLIDLVEGTASALKEAVGNHSSKKSRFAERRIRLPRVCQNLDSLLPVYSQRMAEAQQELLRNNGYSTKEVLYDVEIILRQRTHDLIEHRVLIASETCYCLRQINDSSATVTQQIPYQNFKKMFIEPNADVGKGFIFVAVENNNSKKSTRLVCQDNETAKRLCAKILRAKKLYDRSMEMSSDD